MRPIDEISWLACSASPPASSYFLRRAKCAIQQYSGPQEPVVSKCGFSRANSRRFREGRTAFFQDIRVSLPHSRLITKFACAVFSEIETMSHLISPSPFKYALIPLHFILRAFLFSMTSNLLYSAVMRVQYCAVAQTIMLNECSSPTISARCNLLHSPR